ncbi:MAG: excinuclease ABC subunit UvrC [Bdellovibrionaceae bacterium]|nr:excinuclease ABC subunit UvrC [Pseudobdellovibrionaceae bacterium]
MLVSFLMKDHLSRLKKRVGELPCLPGVYLMKRQEDKILYIGKAKSLKSRVASYFNNPSFSLKTEFLIGKTENIDYILTENEVEAFLLEAVLIKKHKPRYNIRLKDDKSYPYIRFSAGDEFPRFHFERRVKKSKDIYFGPYTEGFTVRALLDFLNKTFHLRDCSNSDFKSRKRPCLNYDIGICPAPCVKKITQKNYQKNCQKALSFLKGKSNSLVKQLKKEMNQAVKELKFERAVQLRDHLQAIEKMKFSQMVYQKSDKDKDIVVLQSFQKDFLIEILHFRRGCLIGNRYQLFKKFENQEDTLLSFLNQYYSENLIPDELIVKLPIKVPRLKVLEKVLSSQKKAECKIRYKLNPEDSLLVKRAEANALNHLKNEINKAENMQELLMEIQKKFHLPKLPLRMECYDISHWQGKYSVGSGVVFKQGQPFKKDYRLYNLKTVADGDDYGALKEVLSRRLKHKEHENPDLILIDGGKGQLKAVKKILMDFGKKDWSVVSLAKDRVKEKGNYTSKTKSTGERFYLPGRKNPVIFQSHSKALKILLYLRDEAHRFAITSHRKKRDKMFLKEKF